MALKERNEALSPINSIVIIQPSLQQRLLSNVLQANDKEASYRIRVDTRLANALTIQSQDKKTNSSSYKISKSIFDPETAPFYWHNVRPFVESTLIGYHGMIIFLQSSHIHILKVTPFDLLFKSIEQILKCIYRSKYKHTQYFQVLFSHYALSIEGGHLFDLCRGLEPASYLYRENNGRQHRLIKTRLIDLEHLKGLIDRNHSQFVSELCQPVRDSIGLSCLGYHEFICVNVGFLGFSASFAPIGGELTFVILSTDYLKENKLQTNAVSTLDVVSTTKLTTNTFKPLLAFLENVTSLSIDINTDHEDALCVLLRDGIGGPCKTCLISWLPDRFGLSEFESEINNEHALILQIAHQSSLVVNCPNRKVFAEKALMNIYLHEINAYSPTERLDDAAVVVNNGEEGKDNEVSEETIKQAAVALEQAVLEFSDGLESEGFEYGVDIPDDNTHTISHNRDEAFETACEESRKLTPQVNVDKLVKISFDDTRPNEPIGATTQIPLGKRTVILDDSPDEVRKIATYIPEYLVETADGPIPIPTSTNSVTRKENIPSDIITEFNAKQINSKFAKRQNSNDGGIVLTPFQQQLFDEETKESSQDIKFKATSKDFAKDTDRVEKFIYEEMLNSERSMNRDNLPEGDNPVSTNYPSASINSNAKKSHLELGNESADTSRLDKSAILINVESAQIQTEDTLTVSIATHNAKSGNNNNEIEWGSAEKSNKKDRCSSSTNKKNGKDFLILSPPGEFPVDNDIEQGKGLKIDFGQKNATTLDCEISQQEFIFGYSEFDRNRIGQGEIPIGHSFKKSQRTPHKIVQQNTHKNLPSTQAGQSLPPHSETDPITDWTVAQPDKSPLIDTEQSTTAIQLQRTNTNSYTPTLTDYSYDIKSPGLLQTGRKNDVDMTDPLSVNYPTSDLLRDNSEQFDIICEEDSNVSRHTKNTMQLPVITDCEGISKRLEVNSPLMEQIDGNQGDAQIAEVVTFMLQDPVRGAPRSHQARGSKEVLQRRDLGGVFTGHAITSWILNNVQGIPNWSEAEVFGQWLLDQDVLMHSEGSFVFAGAESLFYYARRSQPCTGLIRPDEIKRLMSEARKVLHTANTEYYHAKASVSMDKNEAFAALGIERGLADDEMIYHQLMAEQNVVLNGASHDDSSLNAHFSSVNQSHTSSDMKEINGSLHTSASSGGKGSTKKFLWNSEASPAKSNSFNESKGSRSDMFQTHDIAVEKTASEPECIPPPDRDRSNEVINVIEREKKVLVGNITEKYVEINTHTFELHPLFANCRDGCRMGVLRNLIMTFGVNFEDEKKRTGLFYAAAKDQCRVGQELINSHANVNHADKSHTTPLLAAVNLGHVGFMSMLLSHNADVSHFDKTGTNAYHLACKLEALGCLQKLLNKIKPFVLDRIDERGLTPLHYAIRNQFSGHVEMLLKHRPMMSILDSNGLGYLSFAILNHSFNCITPLIKSFPQLAGHPNADCSTALHAAAIQAAPEYLALLLNTKSCKKHYNIQDGDSQGRSPLHAACKKGVDDSVRLLLQHNAHVLSVDKGGLTSLHYAKANERLSQKVIELLEAAEVDEVRGVMKKQDGGSKTCQIQ